MAEPKINEKQVAEAVNTAVNRAIERNRAGVDPLVGLDLDVGVTPKDILHSEGTLKLYHYRPVCDEIYRIPVIVVPSLVSRSYILDLAKGQSLVEYLVGQGFDVYLIDWGTPRPEHRTLALEDYVLRLIPSCIEKVLEYTEQDEISMVGYCLGGMLACIYAATHTDGPLQNLVCFTTPVNSEGMALYKTWTDPKHFDVDRIVDELGNIPPELMTTSMQALRPLQRTAGQMRLLDNADNDEFVEAFMRLDRWAADQVPFPGATAKQFIVDFLRENKLMRGEMKAGEHLVDLGAIRVPFLHVAAQFDHIVPAAASEPLVGLVGSADKQEIVLKGGHVSLVAGGNAVYRLWPKLESWLAPKSV